MLRRSCEHLAGCRTFANLRCCLCATGCLARVRLGRRLGCRLLRGHLWAHQHRHRSSPPRTANVQILQTSTMPTSRQESRQDFETSTVLAGHRCLRFVWPAWWTAMSYLDPAEGDKATQLFDIRSCFKDACISNCCSLDRTVALNWVAATSGVKRKLALSAQEAAALHAWHEAPGDGPDGVTCKIVPAGSAEATADSVFVIQHVRQSRFCKLRWPCSQWWALMQHCQCCSACMQPSMHCRETSIYSPVVAVRSMFFMHTISTCRKPTSATAVVLLHSDLRSTSCAWAASAYLQHLVLLAATALHVQEECCICDDGRITILHRCMLVHHVTHKWPLNIVGLILNVSNLSLMSAVLSNIMHWLSCMR